MHTTPTAPAATRLTLLVMGPFLVDRMRDASGAAPMERPGGNGLVVASVAARLGWPTALVGQVADDALGQSLRRFLARQGVELVAQLAEAGLQTKRAEILVARDGHWGTVATHPQRYAYLRKPAGPADMDGVGAVVITGLCSLWRSCPDAVLAWLALARAQGVPVTLGLNRLSPDEGPVVDRLLEPRDSLFCNRDEFVVWRQVADRRIGGLADALEAAPGGDLVVSLGAEGVLMRPSGKGTLLIPAEPVQVRSTLGAGDVLCAATTVHRLSGLDLRDAVTLAQRSAGRSVQDEGWDGWLEVD